MLIFWDIDGTLMHCGADGTAALNKTFFDLYGIEDALDSAGVGSAMDSAVLERIMQTFALSGVGLRTVKSTYAANLESILAKNTNKRILPGVTALLDYARGNGWTNLLLTTNLRAGAETKLRAVGLWAYFSDSFSESFNEGFGDGPGEKWDAAARAVRLLETRENKVFPLSEIFLVGDGVYDIRCAKRMGIRHIAVATGWTPKEALAAENPDFLLDDLSDTARVAGILNT
ncbi:MAG: haloacid dehalogenase-like hydrolase [Clostridiales Family XIII bacterium]|jgi:phosphoglycolate phosphatase-like HAD superfamily hydrolase|nr:haloacid dehalogenase-like hydrolase [Clostridiales Family XIII bacterium]